MPVVGGHFGRHVAVMAEVPENKRLKVTMTFRTRSHNNGRINTLAAPFSALETFKDKFISCL